MERKTSLALYDSELDPPRVSASPYSLSHLSFTITIHFEDSAEGFNFFLRWSSEFAAKQKKDSIMAGLEPTGLRSYGLEPFTNHLVVGNIHQSTAPLTTQHSP